MIREKLYTHEQYRSPGDIARDLGVGKRKENSPEAFLCHLNVSQQTFQSYLANEDHEHFRSKETRPQLNTVNILFPLHPSVVAISFVGFCMQGIDQRS